MANETIHEFSTPSAANGTIGPSIINADTYFELKPALIMMVQDNPFHGLDHEDANVHL
jgi:hypothetical protein